ncbi:MAG: aldo/keto reductase, partial [Myxococcota bacterium]
PTVELVRRALDTLPVASVQVELSPTHPLAVRAGVIEFARERGIAVLAYRPFGGPGGVAALRRNRALAPLARRAGLPVTAVVCRWLRALGVVPLSGPTSVAHLDALWDCWGAPLDPELRAALDAAFELGRLARPRASRAPPADAVGDVVVVMGRPGAGKSTAVDRYPGYLRLNRDQRGGRLDGLLQPLSAALASGVRQVVLDNTYPSRSSRNGVIEAAWAHGTPVRCEWCTTSEDDAEVNAISRILDALGHLPEPAELVAPTDPALIPPRALHQYRERFEPPEVDEGFTRVDEVPFVRRPWPGDGRVVLVDPRDLTERGAEPLREAQRQGFTVVSHGWAPAVGEQARAAALDAVIARGAALGLAVSAWSCPHPPGPPVCWCRKPYPGLAIAALRALGADPARSFATVGTAADRSVARKLGLRPLPQNP